MLERLAGVYALVLPGVAYAAAARNAGRALSDMQLSAANKAAWNSYLESIDKVNLAVGNAGIGVTTFFQQMSRDTQSAAEQVHTILGGAFNTLNETLVKLMEGQKASFAQFFRGISEGLAKLAIKKTEQSLSGAVLGAMGKGISNQASHFRYRPIITWRRCWTSSGVWLLRLR